jgi:hypothetical protein
MLLVRAGLPRPDQFGTCHHLDPAGHEILELHPSHARFGPPKSPNSPRIMRELFQRANNMRGFVPSICLLRH